jgi:Caspase domain
MRAGALKYPMAWRLGAAQALVLGLVLAAAGLAALSTGSVAEPWWRRDRAAQGVPPAAIPQDQQRFKAKGVAVPKDQQRFKAKSVAVPQDRQRFKAKAVRESDTACSFPWNYSRGLGHCVCIRDGYSLQRGNCLRDSASTSCRDDERWSAKRGACVCAKGLKRQGDACVVAEPVTVVVVPPVPDATPSPDAAPSPETAPPPDAAPSAAPDVALSTSPDAAPSVEAAAKPDDVQAPALPDEQVQAISRAQSCLTELGYYKGPIDGKRGKETWTAYWHFKHDHGLSGYSDLLAETVQQKFDSLCKGPETTAALQTESQPADETQTDATSDTEESAPLGPPPASLDINCLPDDLIALLRRAHGPGVAVERCENACLPTPQGLPQAHLDELQSKYGVVWCRACVPFSGHLALDDVERIESAGNIHLCATPSRQLPPRGSGVGEPVKSYTKVRELYRALPSAAEDAASVAVIIGNRNYAKLPPSETSQNDAGAMYAFLTEHLGFREDNIIDVRDAKKADLERLFGASPGVEGDLARLVRSEPGARVLVYYSGHGATDSAESETYLLPVETESYREELGGYKLSTLYANLAKLDAQSVLVLLETEYGLDHSAYVLPPNLPETTNRALPRAPLPNLTVLAASDRGQRTLIDSTYDIGLFTRYLIEGLAGRADLRPIGNGDGKLDSAEIYVYTAAMVELAARKTFGLLQNPVYSSAATPVLTSAGAAPSRSD